ncbi:MAG TPA: hypothetical protein VHB50_01525 [Bryobacteraceae bacterium]|nr:hypothetical protein [Bryobacteraceae bacterium]
MPCLLVFLILLFPRVILVLMWLFSNVLDRAYHNLVIPLLGFIFLPITTIVYAWLVTNGLPIEGFNLILLIIAVVLDVGSHGGGAGYYRRRRI